MNTEPNITSESTVHRPELFEASEYFISENGIGTTASYQFDCSLSTLNLKLFSTEEKYKSKKQDFDIEILNCIHETDFEFGKRSQLEDIFQKYHESYGLVAVNWLNKLFIRNIRSTKVILAIVLLLSRLRQSDFDGFGETMLSNALYASQDAEINEAAIRVIEKWEATEFAEALRQMKFDAPWLENYKLQVLVDLAE